MRLKRLRRRRPAQLDAPVRFPEDAALLRLRQRRQNGVGLLPGEQDAERQLCLQRAAALPGCGTLQRAGVVEDELRPLPL